MNRFTNTTEGRDAKRIIDGENPKKIPNHLLETAIERVALIHDMKSLNTIPKGKGYDSKRLKGAGNRRSIKINDQYRVHYDWDGKIATRIEVGHWK